MQRKELNAAGVHFFGFGDHDDVKRLEELLKTQKIAALFTEFPSNPLLRCPNMEKLGALARVHDFLIVVDDTISSFANVDLFKATGPSNCSVVDIICSSLTKVFSGRGDVLAGSLVLNPSGTTVARLRAALAQLELPSLFYLDAEILLKNSADFVERAYKINATALQLANWLRERAEVRTVFYPGSTEGDRAMYNTFLRDGHGPGFGCLLSMLPASHLNTEKFYDALQLHKGPSLGTSYTLVCPYVLLAHFCELDWAKSYGLDQSLVRISVGLEDFEVLRDKFAAAFDCAELRPVSAASPDMASATTPVTRSSAPSFSRDSESELSAILQSAETACTARDDESSRGNNQAQSSDSNRPTTPMSSAECGCLIT